MTHRLFDYPGVSGVTRNPETRNHQALACIFTLSFLTLVGAPSAGAGDLRVVFANDFLTTNRLDDDLYTAALSIELDGGQYLFSFGENLFTDTENDVRFDETYFSVERALPSIGSWNVAAEVGAVHVGEGLLGQSAQNAFHSLIGDEEEDLSYVDSNRLYPTLRLRVQRPLPIYEKFLLTAHAEAYSAIGFKQHVAAGLWARLPSLPFATLTAGVGARYTSSEFEPLANRIERFSPTLAAELNFKNKMSVSWTYNEFGTKSEHFTIAYDVGSKKSRAARERRALENRGVASRRGR